MLTVDGKHLKNIKTINIHLTLTEHPPACWRMGRDCKKTGLRKRANSKMAAVYDCIGSAGKFVVSLSPVKVKLVDYLG